jgi:hypothetical protein
MINKKEYLAALEDAFWAGYNARQKQLDISINNSLNVGYQRAQISEREILEKVLEDKKDDVQ